MTKREQQKIYLTPDARQQLRDEAKKRGWEMSDIVEFLILQGAYPSIGAVAKPT